MLTLVGAYSPVGTLPPLCPATRKDFEHCENITLRIRDILLVLNMIFREWAKYCLLFLYRGGRKYYFAYI